MTGWETDVYVFALEDTLVASTKQAPMYKSTDKKHSISGDTVFHRIRGLLTRMKQPFYILAKSPAEDASREILSVGECTADFVPTSPRLYAGREDVASKIEALKTITKRTAKGITLSYVDTDPEAVVEALNTPELQDWKVYWADWAGGPPPNTFQNLDKNRGQVLEVGTFVELIDFGMILGYHDWGV